MDKGEAKWTMTPKSPSRPSSSSKVASCGAVDAENSLVFVGTLDNQILGVNTTDGRVAWVYNASGEICEFFLSLQLGPSFVNRAGNPSKAALGV